MKKRLITAICILAAVTASSCTEPGAVIPEGEICQLEFEAMNEDAQTKTTLASDFSIKWSTKDHITVFSGEGKGTTFSDVTVSSDGRTATFAGSADWSPEYYALYPAQSDAVLSADGTITATLPTTQTAVRGNIADRMNLAIAVSDEDNLLFRNVGALIGITLPTSYGGYLKIESLNPDVMMSGKAEIKMTDGVPVAVPAADAVNYIEFTSLSGLKANDVLYFVAYPGNYDKGFRLTVHNSGKTCKYTLSNTKPLNLERNDNVLLFPQHPVPGTPGYFQWNTAWEPYGITATQTSATSAALTWQCTSADDQTAGYNIYLRDAGAAGNGTIIKTISGKTNTSFEVTGLETGKTYDFGVQTEGGSFKDSEIVWKEDFIVSPDFKTGADIEVTDVKTSYAYIAVSYKIQNLSTSNPEHGICFSKAGVPSVDDIKVSGPQLSSAAEILQVVPNAYLEDGQEYQMSVFVKDGNKYSYSEPQSVRLDAQPAAIGLSWEKQNYSGAEGVDIYKTTSQLNGRNFNAWYAIADPAKVDFRVLNTPTGKANLKTVSHQAENADGECLVLINGGVFGNYHIGVIHVNGTPQEWVDFVYDKYWNPNNDGTSWPITRPIIGVDKSGKAGAYWTSSPAYGTYYYYDKPLPTVPGEAKYQDASSTFPVATKSWTPFNALSTGPMLLYDGKCCIDHVKASSGAYMTNYECWALDIYEGRPDRTAVGVTGDGKIVLFICDGRIDASQGATHEEVAMIMKSLGCVHAMNLDGGGSTGMWVNGVGMINHKDGSWRAVKSTLGFFKK